LPYRLIRKWQRRFQVNAATDALALAKFSSTVVGFGSVQRWGEIMSAATLTSALMIVVFLILQRRIVESLTMTGLK